MSVESLKKFSGIVAADVEMTKKVKEIGLEDVAGLCEYAQSQGHDVTPDDFTKLAAEVGGSDELSDDELDQVAGGFVTALAAAVAGAAVGVATAVTGVTSTTSGSGW